MYATTWSQETESTYFVSCILINTFIWLCEQKVPRNEIL